MENDKSGYLVGCRKPDSLTPYYFSLFRNPVGENAKMDEFNRLTSLILAQSALELGAKVTLIPFEVNASVYVYKKAE